MPLFDHFRSPLSERRPWESFQTTWASCIADLLNEDGLPEGYIALEHVRAGAPIEIDVGTFSSDIPSEGDASSATSTLPTTVWTPAAPPLQLPATFPPTCTVEIRSNEGGRTLVAAIELVSPANKDRHVTKRTFDSMYATYLSKGIGLVVVDVVTTRLGNLHNELVDWLGWPTPDALFDAEPPYSVAYRPMHSDDEDRIETWTFPLALGDDLPTAPLSLGAELCLPLDLEASYSETCRRRRIPDALN